MSSTTALSATTILPTTVLSNSTIVTKFLTTIMPELNVTEFANSTEEVDTSTLDMVAFVMRDLSWALQFITYVVLLYALIYRSPREMGTYKWYICINASHSILMRMFDISCQPFRPDQSSIDMSNGICKYLHFSREFTLFILYYDYLLLTGFLYTLSLLFWFRYVQSANKWMWLFGNLQYYFTGYAIFQFIMLVIKIWAFDIDVKTGDEDNLVHGVFESDPEVKMVITFNAVSVESELLTTAIANFLTWIPLVIAAISILGSYWALHRIKNYVSMHPAARQLYNKLFYVLVADVSIFVLSTTVPYTIYGYCDPTTVIAYILILIPEYYPLMINIVFFIYIKPYRDLITELFDRCFKPNKVQMLNSSADNLTTTTVF